MFEKKVLKNGFRMIVSPMPNSRTVTILVLVRAGSKYEKKDRVGVAHFLEHTLFKGTKRRPRPGEISEMIDRIGGEHNAFTGRDHTGYWIKVSANHFLLALDLVSDMFFNAILKPTELEKERRVILEELKLYQDSPTRFIWDLWGKVLWKDQPAGWYVGGTPETVLRIKRQDLRNFLAAHYIAKNTLVCVAGKVNPKYAFGNIQRFFNALPEKDPPARPSLVEAQTKPEILIHKKNTDQTHLICGVRAFSIFHPERFSAILLATILGGMISSRLFVELREKRGLAYYVRTVSELDPDSGYLATAAGVAHQNLPQALKIILSEYQRLRDKLVGQKELNKAKEFIRGQLSLGLETSDEIASFFGEQEILTNEVRSPEEQFKRIQAVRARDIRDLAQFLFRNDRLNLALIGPHKNIESIRASFSIT